MADPIGKDGSGCYTDHGVSGYGVAVKLTRKQWMNEEFVKTMAETMMISIAENCMDLGARASATSNRHIRTEAGPIRQTPSAFPMAPTRTASLMPVKDLLIAINSIVQGIPKQAVKAATLEGMHEVADQRGLSVKKEKEHTYFDEFDFVAQEKIHQTAGRTVATGR